MANLPLLTEYSIKLLSYNKMRAKKFISFSEPCIGYLLHGTAEFYLNGQSYIANEGDLIYIPALTEYYSLWIGDPQVQWYSVSFAFSDPFAFDDFPFQILRNYPVARLNEMLAHQNEHPLASLSAFYALLEDLHSRMERGLRPPKYTKIRPAIEYLQAHCTEPIQITTLATLCGYSEAHFYTLFRDLMQVSPGTYKTNLLVQRAMRELLETEDSVDAIAARLGFSSANYFCRVFAKAVKKTPGEVRRSARRSKPTTEAPALKSLEDKSPCEP